MAIEHSARCGDFIFQRCRQSGTSDKVGMCVFRQHPDTVIDLSDKQLVPLLHPPTPQKKAPPGPDLETIFYEIKKKSVTLMLLWEE